MLTVTAKQLSCVDGVASYDVAIRYNGRTVCSFVTHDFYRAGGWPELLKWIAADAESVAESDKEERRMKAKC